MAECYNVYGFDHTATAERVINRQIKELKVDISDIIFEIEKVSHSPNELGFTAGRIEELNYQLIKLKLQLDRLTKEDDTTL